MRNPLAPVTRFARLNAAEQLLFLQALAAMVFFRAALCLLPVQRLFAASKKIGRRRPMRGGVQIEPRRAARRIAQAARCCPFSTCLSESLAGYLVMSRLGHQPELRIGVAKRLAKFEAHAWLECGGNVVVGNPSPEGKQYVQMPSLERFFV